MINDYQSNSIQNSLLLKATPRVSTLNIIRQFAESYGIINSAKFPAFNLN